MGNTAGSNGVVWKWVSGALLAALIAAVPILLQIRSSEIGRLEAMIAARTTKDEMSQILKRMESMAMDIREIRQALVNDRG